MNYLPIPMATEKVGLPLGRRIGFLQLLNTIPRHRFFRRSSRDLERERGQPRTYVEQIVCKCLIDITIIDSALELLRRQCSRYNENAWRFYGGTKSTICVDQR